MISYLLLRFAVFLFSFIPFGMLYRISDGIAYFLYKIMHYRYTVIHTNLKNSFPEKSDVEIEAIIQKTYLNLSDIIVESVKGMSMNLKEIVERYHFKNPEVADKVFRKGLSAIGLVSHYNNWEWGAYATEAQLKLQVAGVFKPIKNKMINQYFHKIRSRFGAQIVAMNQTGRAIIENRGKPTLFVLIADQNPSNLKHVHWINFLNQDTACFDGPEKIARKTNYPVLHFAIERVKRGFYEIEVSMLCENPGKTFTSEITRQYMKTLEKQIQEKPENWLWSHRRWKHKKVRS